MSRAARKLSGAPPVCTRVLVEASLGIACAAAVFVVVEAFLTYPRLPDRVPLHFNLRGDPGMRGPKWLLSGLFVALAACLTASLLASLLAFGPAARGLEAGVTITATAVLVFLAYVQHAMIEAARRPGNRLATAPFWIAFLALLGTVVAAVTLT